MYSHPTLKETVTKRVEKVIPHPQFKRVKQNFQNFHLDIAILKISQTAISDTIYPCCLPPPSSSSYIGKKAIG